MNDMTALMLALLAGISLGLMFFGGLWWTVQKGAVSRRPALLFLVSFIVRMGLALGGFYLMSFGHWSRLLSCLTGFVAARALTIHLLAPALEKRVKLKNERSHAP